MFLYRLDLFFSLLVEKLKREITKLVTWQMKTNCCTKLGILWKNICVWSHPAWFLKPHFVWRFILGIIPALVTRLFVESLRSKCNPLWTLKIWIFWSLKKSICFQLPWLLATKKHRLLTSLVIHHQLQMLVLLYDKVSDRLI